MDRQTISKGGRSMEGHDLRWCAEFMDRAMIVSLVVAAIAAAAVGVTTWLSIKFNGEVREEESADFQRYKIEAARRVSDNETETRRADARAAEAIEKAEKERHERSKLEAEIAPRAFSSYKLQAIAEQLKPFSGRKVSVWTYSMDLEGGELATQIIEALVAANLEIDDRRRGTLSVGGVPIIGVEVFGPDTELVGAILSALSGEPRVSVSNPGSVNRAYEPSARATIWVGIKPLPKIK